MANQAPGHGIAVDWWALGILLYEFLVGQPPFWDQNPMKIYEMYVATTSLTGGLQADGHRIVEGKLRYPHGMSPEARDLIAGLCTVNPSQRLGNISGGTQRVKSHPFFRGIDWDALYNRQQKGPIIPHLRHAADTSNFDNYDDAPESKSIYTDEMANQYEDAFQDF